MVIHPPLLRRPLRNWALCSEYKTGPKNIFLGQVSYRMTLILFTVFARKTCSAVSPLPEDFYAYFGGDPFTDDSPHDGFMRSVFSRGNDRTASFMLHAVCT